MNKYLASALAAAALLLSLALGLFLPSLVMGAQNSRAEGGTETFELGDVDIIYTSVSTAADSLRLVAEAVNEVELKSGRGLTSAEAEQAAREAAQTLFEMLIYMGEPPNIEVSSVTPFLYCNADASLTGIYWRCQAHDGNGCKLSLTLDDASGRIAAFRMAVSDAGVMEAFGAANGYAEAVLWPLCSALGAYYSEELMFDTLVNASGDRRELTAFARFVIGGAAGSADAALGYDPSTYYTPTPTDSSFAEQGALDIRVSCSMRESDFDISFNTGD